MRAKEISELLKKLDNMEIPELGLVVDVLDKLDRIPKGIAAVILERPHRDEIAYLGIPEAKGFFSVSTEEGIVEEKLEKSEGITYPEKSEFTYVLAEVLNSLPEYKNVDVQSIRRQNFSRVPIYVVAFTHGKYGERVGHIYIKDYKENLHFRKKDTVLPAFMEEIGVPSVKVIGYDFREGEFDRRLAFLQPTANGVLLDNIGQEDYSQRVMELGKEALVKSGKYVIELMALMHVRATKNLGKLKSEYGLELEGTDHAQLIRERLLEHLTVKNNSIKANFEKAYSRLEDFETDNGVYFVHGDFTTNNIRVGENLSTNFLIDFELARKDGFSPEDLEMLVMFTLSLRQDRDAIRDLVKDVYREHYFAKFNSVAQSEAPHLMLDERSFKSDGWLEEVRGHLYKIGDQVWTQKRFGQSDARKYRAQWHLAMLNSLVNEAYSTSSGEERRVLKELHTATVNLLDASTNVSYLKPVLNSIR